MARRNAPGQKPALCLWLLTWAAAPAARAPRASRCSTSGFPGRHGFVLRQVRPDPAPLLQPAAGCKRGTGQGSPLPEERWLLLSTQWGFSNRKLTISCFLHHLAPHQLAFSRVTRPLALASDSTLAETATGSLRFSSHPYVCTNQLFTFYKKSTLLEASALAITIYYFG